MNILILGATSGIGKALFLNYASAGNHKLFIAGRRLALLEEMKATYPSATTAVQIDITQIQPTTTQIDEIWTRYGTIDLCFVCAGIGEMNPNLSFEIDKPIIETNVMGWTNAIDHLYNKFHQQGGGHIVAISSIAGLRGEPTSPIYSASKAFQINYLEALRKKTHKQNNQVFVTDVRPGFVDTQMAKGEGLFWVMPTQKVAAQIIKATNSKRAVAIVTKRWRIIHFILKHLPEWVYVKV